MKRLSKSILLRLFQYTLELVMVIVIFISAFIAYQMQAVPTKFIYYNF